MPTTHALFADRPQRPLLMGILNVTPDSFSDGGKFDAVDAAVAHARTMVEQGADLIDVGGESTRPGAKRVSVDQQIARVAPVIDALSEALGDRASISIDTTRAAVAAAALDAGAVVLNDVSAGTEDPDMLALAAERGVPIVLMHMRGEPGTMQDGPRYGDVVTEVETYLLKRAAAAEAAGVARDHIVIDPGIGFGKTTAHNHALLAALPRFVATGYPILLGASRKRFLGPDLPPADRVYGTCVTTAMATRAGVAIVRVHDVAANRQARDVAIATADAGTRGHACV